MVVFNIYIYVLDLSVFLVFSVFFVFSVCLEMSYGVVVCLVICKWWLGSSQLIFEYVVDKKNGICILDEDLEDSLQIFEGS